MLWLVPFLIIASWGGNLWYYQSMQLEKPLFLKHYIALDGNIGDWMELTYFENKSGGKKVTGIQLEQLPTLRFHIQPNQNSYSHQVIGKAYGEVRKEDFASVEQVPMSIKEATVFYNEGPPEKVPIGEIQISWGKSDGLLQMSYSRGSSNGTGEYNVSVNESLVLERIEYSFGDRLNPVFELTTTGGKRYEPITQLPLQLDVGDPLSFSYQWNIPDEMPAAAVVYKVYLLLTFKNENGRTVHDRIPFNFNHYLSEKQIKQLVRSGGELP